jgi:hypothetical protein
MTDKITVRLQTPQDANGNRKDMHPITTTDEVIVDPSSSNPRTLTSKLSEKAAVVSGTQPGYACLWVKPI